MQVPKQELIDAYGHFYLLCDVAPDGGERRVHTNISKYGELGDGEPRPPKKLLIREFLGRPEWCYGGKVAASAGVLKGITRPDMNAAVFDTREAAVERADAIIAAVDEMYEKLRGKWIKPKFSTETPEILVDYAVLPDSMDFPAPAQHKKGAQVFCLPRSPADRDMDIYEAEIETAQLFPVEISGKPFSFRYDLVIGANVPTGLPKIGAVPVTRHMTLTPKSSSHEQHWAYQVTADEDREYFPDGVMFFGSREDAEKGAGDFALRAFGHLQKFLPQATAG